MMLTLPGKSVETHIKFNHGNSNSVHLYELQIFLSNSFLYISLARMSKLRPCGREVQVTNLHELGARFNSRTKHCVFLFFK